MDVTIVGSVSLFTPVNIFIKMVREINYIHVLSILEKPLTLCVTRVYY